MIHNKYISRGSHYFKEVFPIIADFIGLPFFSGFPSGLKSHVLISYAFLNQSRLSSHVLEASIKTPKEILFCKQTGWYILHTKLRISCKRPLRAALYVYCYLENQFYVFQTAPVVVYRLMTSVSSASQHRCY